jgi:hypothetical protein
VVGINLGNAAVIDDKNLKPVYIKDKIAFIQSFGKANDTEFKDHNDFWNATNAFDNSTKSYNGWSQWGNTAGIDVILSSPISESICKVEFNVLDPKNQPYKLILNDKILTGIINAKKVSNILDSKDCIKDISKINLKVDSNKKWITIHEISLLTNKSGNIPDPEPPVCPPGQYYNPELKQCIKIPDQNNNHTISIVDGNTTISVKNSTLTINVDKDSVIHPTIVESIEKVEKKLEKDKEEQQEEQQEDIEDNNKEVDNN